ncbi:hypothetical protein V2J09_005293 [Rumex salicifolius]
MMIGEIRRSHPTVQIPQWDSFDDSNVTINLQASYFAGAHSPPASSDFSPSAFAADYAAALHSYIPSNYEVDSDNESDLPFDSFSCDEFRMYEFKVRRCVRGRSHDWTECPFAHPGEKARRRDPRRYHYSGTPCPEFRKGSCKKGDSCEFAHGVFECWLHPARYRTQPCKDGTQCKRRVCFFAHSPDQLRVDSPSPSRLAVLDSVISPPADSPPMSPSGGAGYRSLNSVNELVGSMRGLQIGSPRSCTWGLQLPGSSPRSGSGFGPVTPTRIGAPTRLFDCWNLPLEEEPAMERVESGKNLRAAMYAKLRMENSLDRSDPVAPGPDFGWVSELVK